MAYDPLDSQADPFRPPETAVEVSCLHCGQQYESYLIEWRVETSRDGTPHGFWCCPTPGCDGRGFGFDIFPTDPHYHDERGGWVCDDDEEFDEDESDWDEVDDLESEGPSSNAPESGNGHGDPRNCGPDDIPF